MVLMKGEPNEDVSSGFFRHGSGCYSSSCGSSGDGYCSGGNLSGSSGDLI